MQIDLLDVFANGSLSGNPLAVVHGGAGLDDAAMLALTRWLGFSETTFLLPPTDPGADYRVRIFFPAGELPFAGHPTLGSAAAWLAAGGTPRQPGVVVQQCGVGLVPVRHGGCELAFCAPPLRRGGPLEAEERAEAIRIAGVAEQEVVAAAHADNGPPWVLLHLASAEAVLAATPLDRAASLVNVGLIGPHRAHGAEDSQPDWEVRAFFSDPAGRIVEDPVTGSFNAAAAQYLFAAGLSRTAYCAAQGRVTGADGRVRVEADSTGALWIGGTVRTIARGGALSLS